jgi:xanthine dehydrogenase small subunit
VGQGATMTMGGGALSSPDARVNRVRFWFRGAVREIADVPPLLSVLHWLREADGSTGTKEGCNQGDCGACTVVLAEVENGRLRVHTANSCLLPVPRLHGRALFTIEDVAVHGTLHPVQQAMVEHGGSQCGFCTPGFVMSLWCAAEQNRLKGTTPSAGDLADSISGNLCRCTGYRPILDAASAALQDTTQRPEVFDASRLRATLEGIDGPGTLHVTSGRAAFIAPDTEESLADVLQANPTARVISGGTDLVLSMRGAPATLEDAILVSTERVAGLRRIAEADGQLSIGAAARLEDAWRAIVDRAPGLARMHRRFASPAIRSVGTIGGNVANGSPIADLTPVLLALDAAVTLSSADGSRTVPLAEFGTGVRTNVLTPGEYLSRIAIPVHAFDRDLRSYKVSRRFDDDISSVSATFALAHDGPVISDLRIVFGGMATTVRRASGTEAALRGRAWNEAALHDAQAALVDDFSPITDHRASAHYRRRAASGLLHRWWLETGMDAPSVPVDLWSAT